MRLAGRSSLVVLYLLGCGWRGSVWIVWSVLFSVDCFGGGVYIDTRAWMLFSPFFVSWHVLVVRAALLVLPPPSLSSNAPLIGSSGARAGAIFFINLHLISSHPIIGCLLAGLLFATRLPSYPYRPAPRPATIDTIGGEVHGCDTADGWRRCRACLILLVRCHPSHEMMMKRRKRMRQRRDAIG